MSEADATATPIFVPVPLDKPIVRGDQRISEITLRKPDSGELRGLKLVDLTQLDINSLHKLLPRITSPSITELEVQKMDPADLLACAAEVSGFLLQRRDHPDSQPT